MAIKKDSWEKTTKIYCIGSLPFKTSIKKGSQMFRRQDKRGVIMTETKEKILPERASIHENEQFIDLYHISNPILRSM